MTSREFIRELEAAGWKEVRVNGSHHMFKNAAAPQLGTLSVPHPKKELGEGLLKKLRKQAGL